MLSKVYSLFFKLIFFFNIFLNKQTNSLVKYIYLFFFNNAEKKLVRESS